MKSYRMCFLKEGDENQMNSIIVTEWCPHCDKEQTFLWDVEKKGYQAFCPSCGENIMLCSECPNINECDWKEDLGCMMKGCC